MLVLVPTQDLVPPRCPFPSSSTPPANAITPGPAIRSVPSASWRCSTRCAHRTWPPASRGARRGRQAGRRRSVCSRRDPSVRYVSMHQYPWYPGTGAEDERGLGNVLNVPRPPGLPRAVYVRDLLAAVDAAIAGWPPDLLLVSAGFDSLNGDPLGGFTLEPEDMARWTALLRERVAPAPVVCVLEGGYRLDLLAAGARARGRALA